MTDNGLERANVGSWIEVLQAVVDQSPDNPFGMRVDELWDAAEVLEITSDGAPAKVRYNNGIELYLHELQKWRRLHS
jgi:hypothetical protein